MYGRHEIGENFVIGLLATLEGLSSVNIEVPVMRIRLGYKEFIKFD
jgi:hypothetical protein